MADWVNRPGFDGGSGLRNLPDRGVAGLTVVLFEFDRRALADGVVDPGGVEPVDPAGGFLFDLGSASPTPAPVVLDQLGLVEPDRRLDEGIVPRRQLRLIPLVGSMLFE